MKRLGVIPPEDFPFTHAETIIRILHWAKLVQIVM